MSMFLKIIPFFFLFGLATFLMSASVSHAPIDKQNLAASTSTKHQKQERRLLRLEKRQAKTQKVKRTKRIQTKIKKIKAQQVAGQTISVLSLVFAILGFVVLLASFTILGGILFIPGLLFLIASVVLGGVSLKFRNPIGLAGFILGLVLLILSIILVGLLFIILLSGGLI